MSQTNSRTEKSPTHWIDLGMCFLGLLVSTVIAVGTYIVTIIPLEGLEQSFQARIASASTLCVQGDELRTQHRTVSQQLAAEEATFATVIERIPETPHESVFLGQITEVARDCQLRIQTFQPRDPVNEGTYTALEVQLDATASYEGLCRFLDGLRTLARLCRVTRLKLNTIDGDRLTMEMTLRIYYAPLTKPAKT